MSREYFLISPNRVSTTLRLLIDFGLDETREISQRILPTEIARFYRNGVGKTFLHDIQLGAARYWLERHRHLDFARQIGIVEFVRVAQALAGHELEILSAERVALASGEIAEGHPEAAADFRVEVVHGAGKAVGRQPLRHGICLDEGAIDLIGLRCQDAVQSNGIGHGYSFRAARMADERSVIRHLRSAKRAGVPDPRRNDVPLSQGHSGIAGPGREFVTFRFGNGSKQCALTGASMGGIAMRLLRSRARVQVDSDTQVEGQVERAVEIFSRVEGEIRDFVRRGLAASRHRLEDCSDLTPGTVDSLLQRLSGTTVQEIDHFIAELQALRQRLQHEATRVERKVVQYASLNEAARASMRTISENLSF